MAGVNSVGWFEIGTDNLGVAEKFYGDVFGWKVGHDGSDGPGYHQITAGDGPGLNMGGLVETGGAVPAYAVFGVLVADVADTCERVKAAGGAVKSGPQVTPGGIASAHLLDPAGNQFEVFSMPPEHS